MDRVQDRLQRELQARAEAGALRKLQVHAGLVDLASNDYLGFARDAQLRRMVEEEIKTLPALGSGGSRLLTGNNDYVETIEKEIAAFHAAESALFFNSGYEANSGLLSTVVHRHDIILYDALIHASLREGIRLSGAKAYSFAHNDMQELAHLLHSHSGNVFVVTESVFSMDGDLAPLLDIADLCECHQAALIVDEAHATGVIGARGEGLVQQLGLQNRCFARVHTFGKAMGSNGAVVMGSKLLRDYLINYCKPFIYTTAPNYLQLAAVRMAYQYLAEQEAPRQQLQSNLQHMRTLLQTSALQPVSTDSAIFSFIIPGNDRVRTVAASLRDHGYDLRPIMSPTVPAGSERIRICVHAFNSPDELSAVIKLFQPII